TDDTDYKTRRERAVSCLVICVICVICGSSLLSLPGSPAPSPHVRAPARQSGLPRRPARGYLPPPFVRPTHPHGCVMSRTAPLQVSQLEEREVPSAAMFADIRAGIWGSYPLNLTPSGNTLFFSADDGHGYELYATDGTPGSAHLVKDVRPGLGGSNPNWFFTADNGVVYFT